MALPYKELLPELANQIAERLGLKVCSGESQFDLIEDYLGKGYGIPGGLEREAISLLARSEGILLDRSTPEGQWADCSIWYVAGRLVPRKTCCFGIPEGAPHSSHTVRRAFCKTF